MLFYHCVGGTTLLCNKSLIFEYLVVTVSVEVQKEIERIFDLGTAMQPVVLDCENVNTPGQVAKSCLAPIIVYLKISSIRVLQRLIKNRGQGQKKHMNIQTAALEKLLQCPEVRFL